MNLDFGLLNKRIKSSKQEVNFYIHAVDMLLNKYNAHKLMKEHQLEFKMQMLPSEFSDSFMEGVIPNDDVMRRCAINNLDDFVQEMMYLLGSLMGVGYLQHQKETEEDTDDYIDFILMTTRNPEYCIQASGFSAWTLLTERVPSGQMLERMFPYTQDQEVNQISANLIAEMHSDTVTKYVTEKELERPIITRSGIEE